MKDFPFSGFRDYASILKPRLAISQPDITAVQPLCDTAHVVFLSERKASAIDEICDSAFQKVRRIVH
jgi:hypothetical protein